MTNDEDRFWAKVDKTDGCWLWTAYVNNWGYGQFNLEGKHVLAHRYAYELLVGPIPPGHKLDHRKTCLKRCVTPTHLRPATDKRNQENRQGATVRSKSGVRGVCWHKQKKKWVGQVGHNGKIIYVGAYDSIEDAEQAVVAKREHLFGSGYGW